MKHIMNFNNTKVVLKRLTSFSITWKDLTETELKMFRKPLTLCKESYITTAVENEIIPNFQKAGYEVITQTKGNQIFIYIKK